jgi:signal transduction histidine kinase
VGADGAASLYQQLAGFRRSLLALGASSALTLVLLSIIMGRFLVRPLRRLESAAARIGGGDLAGEVVVTSRDEIGLVAETLEAMRRALAARDERMQMMLAGIAHEVRNPLAGMELYAGLLREELPDGGTPREHVARIERELDHLKTIVSEFLEYARRPTPQLDPCDVAGLLAEVCELSQPAAQARGVHLELVATAAQVRGDAGQLRRALLNLVSNAVQACSDGAGGRVQVDCRRQGGEVVVTVRDSGAGIAPELRDQIWTPFFTTKQSGTGLGLAFVREIARDHGARLEVDSAPGRGTTFLLALREA